MSLNLRPPSSATAISWLALVIALGGTAFGAAATLVKIEGGTGGFMADVDRAGALSTSSIPAPPRVPFTGFAFLNVDNGPSPQTLIGPSTSTAVLTSFTLGNNMDQTNGAHVRMVLLETQSTSSSCSGTVSSQTISIYQAAAGQSFQATYPDGLVLKPAAHGQWWCLTATAGIQGDPSSYFIPEASWIGYVAAGTLVPRPAAPDTIANAIHPQRHR